MKKSLGWFCWYSVVALLCTLFSSLTNGQLHTNHLRYLDSLSNGVRVDETLKFVAVVAAHGNVAPSFNYSDNPYPSDNLEYWPFGVGELSKVGRSELYALGEYARSLYDGFVDEDYDSEDFAAYSPEVDRTTMCAQLFTAGLYPPVGYEVWDSDLLWQPILMNTDSSDKTLDVSSCAKFVELSAKAVKKLEKSYKKKISTVNKYLKKNTGVKMSGLEDIAAVWEMLYSQKMEGLDGISWATEKYVTEMQNLTGEYYKSYYAGSDDAVKLVIGTLLEEIITAMQSKESSSTYELGEEDNSYVIGPGPGPNPTQNPGPNPGPNPTGNPGPNPGPNPTGNPGPGPSPFSSNPNFAFYSGFNASLITLQAALGLASYDIVSPVPPGSAIIFELHEKSSLKSSSTSDYYVEVFWVNGGTELSDPVAIKIPSCGTSCDLTTFVSLTADFTTSSYDSDCKTSS